MKAVTLEELVNAGKAIITAGEYSVTFDQLAKGEWYTVFVDIHKFGEIQISNNDRGVQVASQSTIEFKVPEFVKNSDIPDAKVQFPFNAVSPKVTLTTELNNGDAITTYTNKPDDSQAWNSRIQLTPVAYGEYVRKYAAGNKVMAFDFKYEGTVSDIYFWRMDTTGGYGDQYWFSGLISDGTITLYKADGTTCAYGDMKAGEWYTAKFDMAKFGALNAGSGHYGFHMGCSNVTTMQFKNFKFEDKN